MFIEILTDTAMDSITILPFLFLAFCILETVSHHSERFNTNMLLRFKHVGPLIGSLIGCLPQCGIPVLAINLYAGMLITPGTLISVLVSTSDEAILVLLNEPAGQKIIFPLLVIKIIIAATAGYFADIFLGRFFTLPEQVSAQYNHEFCHTHGVLLSALGHTIEIFSYVFLFTFALNFLLHIIGFKTLASLVLDGSAFQPFLTACIGLIPNCAAALILCELYLNGMLSFASLISGLCTSAGVGLFMLFKTHMPKKELFKIILFLYFTAVISGIILQIFL